MPLFSYRRGTSFLHRMSPLLKLFFLFGFTVLIFFFPNYVFFYSVFFVFFARFIGFSFLEQLRDLKPILPYCLLIVSLHVFSVLIKTESSIKDLVFLILKLICLMQISSLFFNTTSSLQLKETLEKILPFKLAVLFSLFLFFIPILFSIWTKLDHSWKARGGKKNLLKIFKLFPIFISEALYKGQKLMYALRNRSE
ncbi:CbiQ family ECF transporter T component [Treponema denticola]|uniref:CbiQ family ECF transporter T component n=1 Tax=Treponema denticola TaxID=158 RepID=UPI0005D20660|nr:CbiQ family ECF transporter T component [Treponema denticola]